MNRVSATKQGFRDEYAFLSNFARFEMAMTYDGITFLTNEHFYQAMKSKDRDTRKKIAEHPSKALKAFCNTLPIRKDWDDMKIDVMEFGLTYKFSDVNPKLKAALVATKGVDLIEYNYWGDKFWGVCSKTGEGENNLGKILMKIRDNLE